MTNQEVFDLIACFDRSTAQTMRLTMGDVSLELTRGNAAPAAPQAPMPAAAVMAEAAPKANGLTINAPLVGTFYAASAPDQPPMVAVGDKVKKGQTVCLLEAMKMMSEISAPCDCVIEEICKANGELVAFGEPLMRYRPC